MYTLPAPAGTYLLEREQGASEARKIPVIGFALVQATGPVFPLCAVAHGGLTRGRVLVTADGFVTDPSFGVVCGSVDEWMALSAKPGYWAKGFDEPAPVKPEDGEGDAGRRDDAVHGVVSRDTAEKLASAGTALNNTPTRIPDKPKGKPQVFQTKSFWRVAGHRDLDTPEIIFAVEGGVDAPAKNDTTFEKIKRDDYDALKRAGATVRAWPIVEEEPAEAADEAADEEDDGSGLI